MPIRRPPLSSRAIALVMLAGLAGCTTLRPDDPPPPAPPNAPFAAQPVTRLCVEPPFRQMDFWIGTWTVTWTDKESGRTLTGRNTIQPILGGCAIQEQFDGAPGNTLRGMSLSTYHRAKEEWRQLWVDNEGGYLPFAGGPVGDDFILVLRRDRPEDAQRRMVWEDITPESLTWRWQSRASDEAAWTDIWVLTYERDGHPLAGGSKE